MFETDVKLTAKDLYNFMIFHTYGTSTGIVGSCFGALLAVYGFMTAKIYLIICGIIILAYIPVSLYTKSKKQAKNKIFEQPLHYLLDENGITVSQGEVTNNAPWERVFKVTASSKGIYIYTSPVNATIIPRKELKDEVPALLAVIAQYVEPKKNKVRF